MGIRQGRLVGPELQGRDTVRLGCYGADMQWPAVQKRIRAIWPKIQRHVPTRSKGIPRRGATYTAQDAFEAMLYILWHNTSIREYRSAACLSRTVSPWLEPRALDKLWASYLAELSKKELLAWRERIERNRQGKRKHGGFSLAVSWCLILWRVFEDICEERGIDLDISRERA